MSTGMCSRCGRRGEIEYGTDGLPYCSSCIFYGTMKQCWRCQMYLPSGELQQYRGQWVCPYCIADMRREEKKMEEYKPPPKREPLRATELRYRETCDRCGKETEVLYIWNNRKLCASCLADEQKKWGLVGGGPRGAPYRVTVGREKSFFQKLIDAILTALGLKKREKAGEIVALKKEAGKKKRFGKKPRSEGLEKKEAEEPALEGIEKEAKGPFERYKKE